MPEEKESSGCPARRRLDDGQWLGRTDNAGVPRLNGRPSPREQEREDALADWVGEERRAAVFAELRPKSASMETLVNSLLATVNPEEMQLLEELRSHWGELVGDVNARQCAPDTIEGSTLKVNVYNSAWLYILKSGQQAIITRRVSDFTSGRVNALVFKTAGAFRRRSTGK